MSQKNDWRGRAVTRAKRKKARIMYCIENLLERTNKRKIELILIWDLKMCVKMKINESNLWDDKSKYVHDNDEERSKWDKKDQKKIR